MEIWIIVLATSIWVYVDAKSIGVRKGLVPGFLDLGPGGWCAASLLLWIVGFPCYLIMRSKLKAAAAAEAGNLASTAAAEPANPSPAEPSAATESEALASLEKLAELRDRGILTGAEFEQKKQQLLAG